VQWTRRGEIRSGDYGVFYFRGESAERDVAKVVHKRISRSVVKQNVFNDIVIAPG
jgi:hypothetical protein